MSPRILSELCGWENIQTHLQATPSTLSAESLSSPYNKPSAEGAQSDAEDRGARWALPVPLKSSLNTACVKLNNCSDTGKANQSKSIMKNPVPKEHP